MTRIIRITELKDRLGISRSAVYDKLDPASPRYDPAFPKQFSIGAKAVGWVESEVEEWIKQRIAASRGVA